MSFHLQLAIYLLLLSFSPIQTWALDYDHQLTRVSQSLEQGVDNLYQLQKRDRDDRPYWNYGYYLGSLHSSIYLLYYLYFLKIEQENVPNNIELFRQILRQEQYQDGSWKDFKDKNFDSGTLDATILNYFALKVMGENIGSSHMRAARRYILQHGGIEAGTFLAKFTLAVFNNYPWKKVPSIPAFWLKSIDLEGFAQWIAPNFYPVFYMRKMEITVTKPTFPTSLQRGDLPDQLNRRLKVDELFIKHPGSWRRRSVRRALNDHGYYSNKLKMNSASRKTLTYYLKPGNQLPNGSWGAYGPATAMGIVVLQDLLKQMRNRYSWKVSHQLTVKRSTILDKIKHAKSYLANMSLDALNGNYYGLQSYGQFWDTALTVSALMDVARVNSIENPSSNAEFVQQQRLKPTGEYLLTAQGSDGGFGFGHDFQTMADADDTSEIILALTKLGLLSRGKDNQRFRQAAWDGYNWLSKLQSKDLGMPAFMVTHDSHPILRFIFQLFAPDGFLFDPSSPDVSGHALEAMIEMSNNLSNKKHLPLDLVKHPKRLPLPAQKLITYLTNSVTRNGRQVMWKGKWGVNYLYGTSAALGGLYKAGATPGRLLSGPKRYHQLGHTIMQSLRWLQSCQNSDGGFGESSDSYDHIALACHGKSSASQTAWALNALIGAKIDGDQQLDLTIIKAAQYLMRQMEQQGKWQDETIVGTGFPGFLYMRYDAYPRTFPLMALASYKEWLLTRRSATFSTKISPPRYQRPIYQDQHNLYQCTPPKAHNRNFKTSVNYFRCIQEHLQCQDHNQISYLENLMFKTMEAEQSSLFTPAAHSWFAQVNSCFANKLHDRLQQLSKDNFFIPRDSACNLIQKTLYQAHQECFEYYGFCNGSHQEKLAGTIYDNLVTIIKPTDYRIWLKLIIKTLFTTEFEQVLSRDALATAPMMGRYILCALRAKR
ncbi:MAG: hypothetical protein HN353_05200 [Bdellovibrionales bacterium]|nr:hypothetical protein [Bdellovibrionales bacterium]MBT3525025.1 hypothetical protein [Bdellovibrionales bacterium]